MKCNWRYIYPVLAAIAMIAATGLCGWLGWLGVSCIWWFFSPETFWQRIAAFVLVILPAASGLLTLLGFALSAIGCLLFDWGVGPPRRRVWQVTSHCRRE